MAWPIGFFLSIFLFFSSPAYAQFAPEDPKLRTITVSLYDKDKTTGQMTEAARWPWSDYGLYYNFILRQSLLHVLPPDQTPLLLATTPQMMITEEGSSGYLLRRMLVAGGRLQIQTYLYHFDDYYDAKKLHDALTRLFDEMAQVKNPPSSGWITLSQVKQDGTTARIYLSGQAEVDKLAAAVQDLPRVPDADRPGPPDEHHAPGTFMIVPDPRLTTLPYQIEVSPTMIRLLTRDVQTLLFWDNLGLGKDAWTQKMIADRARKTGLPAPLKRY